MDARQIVAALGGRWRGGRGVARCPAHADREPSLSIAQGDDGRLLVRCFAGCPFEAVRDALSHLGLLPATGRHPWAAPDPAEIARREGERREEERHRIERARRIWARAKPDGLRRLVRAYWRAHGRQPTALIATSALSSASLAAQGLVDVARDPHLIGPVSLYSLLVAESGERKTSADRRLARAPRRWMLDQHERLAAEVAEARARVAAYQAERDGILVKAKSLAGKPDEAPQLQELQGRLSELEKNAPREVILPQLFHEDASPEALAQDLALGWPSASVWSDEGGLVVGGRGMSDDSILRYLGLLNRLWDGTPFKRGRTTAHSFVLRGRRLTCSLMMQQAVLTRLLHAAGGASRGIGFIARFLLARPPSTMGTRLYREADLEAPPLEAFDRRLTALLNQPLPTGGGSMVLEPTVLALSDAARRTWIEYHDDVERELGAAGEYADVADIAAKSAENAARLAAVMHVMEYGPAGEIGAELMQSGAELAAWHLHEARRIMGAVRVPQAVADAHLLVGWIKERGVATSTAVTS